MYELPHKKYQIQRQEPKEKIVTDEQLAQNNKPNIEPVPELTVHQDALINEEAQRPEIKVNDDQSAPIVEEVQPIEVPEKNTAREREIEEKVEEKRENPEEMLSRFGYDLIKRQVDDDCVIPMESVIQQDSVKGSAMPVEASVIPVSMILRPYLNNT